MAKFTSFLLIVSNSKKVSSDTCSNAYLMLVQFSYCVFHIGSLQCYMSIAVFSFI